MTTQVHTLIGAYVLDAVDDAEREAVKQHLDECSDCEQEVRELRVTVARLADVTVTEPPEGMREQVLAQARRTRQDPPPEGDSPQKISRRHNVPRWRRVWVAAAAAVVLALAAGLSTFAFMQQQLEQERTRQDNVTEVLAANDAEVAEGDAAGGGRVTVVSSASRDQAVVLLSGLENIDQDRSYQLWKVKEQRQTSGGVLEAGDNSATMLVSGVNDADLIGVTEEPSGGSDSPTLPMVADVKV